MVGDTIAEPTERELKGSDLVKAAEQLEATGAALRRERTL